MKSKIQVNLLALDYNQNISLEEELEEKGLEWDELEEEAEKDDRKHENRFGKADEAVKPKKRTKRDG